MRVWILGANGFIGRHIARACEQAGLELVVRPRIDLGSHLAESDWHPHLDHVDAVVNAVGVLRDSRQKPIESIHTSGPISLFNACVTAKIKKLVQISALGIENGATRYARSKKAADEHVWSLVERGLVDGYVVRPSIVIGQGGASANLFWNLARLPLIPIPIQVANALAQPLAVEDLAQAVVSCLQQAPAVRCLNLAGPEVMSIGQLISSWRTSMGHAKVHLIKLPTWMGSFSARLGDWVPGSPWCTETLSLLETPNRADSGVLATLLGHPPRSIRLWPQHASTQAL